MGRIRPIEAFGEDGERAAVEMAEALGLMTDAVRAHYSQYYDTEGKLLPTEKPFFGTIKADLGDREIGILTTAQEAAYYNSEFDVE